MDKIIESVNTKNSDIKKCDDCGFYFWVETMVNPYSEGFLCEVCFQKILDNAWEETEKFFGKLNIQKYSQRVEIK